MRRAWAEGREGGITRSTSFDDFYHVILPSRITETKDRIHVLDLGCGTGLEIAGIVARAPNAQITGVDVSANILDELRMAHHDLHSQLRLVCESYIELLMGETTFEYIISAMTIHHLMPGLRKGL